MTRGNVLRRNWWNLRFWLRGSPTWFGLYHRCLTGSANEIIPSRTTQLVVTSWGRSGNTFVRDCVRRLSPDAKLATHGHTLATVRQAMRLNCPCIVTFRKPEECITSAIVKQGVSSDTPDDLLCDRCVRDYVWYHAGLVPVANSLYLLEFHEFTTSPDLILACCEQIGIPLATTDLKRVEDAVLTQIRSNSASMAPEASGLDNEVKAEKKRRALQLLHQHPDFSRCRSLFDTLYESRFRGT